MADLDTTQRAHILLEDDSFALFPVYSGVSSDPAVVTVGDGGAYRLAAVAQGVGSALITITRAADGMTADLLVTVEDAPSPGEFTIHLGPPFPKA